jgi:hypothetical protein
MERRVERQLPIQRRMGNMDALLVGTALAGSVAMAFVLQKAALGALLRALTPDRRAKR